MAPAIDLSCYAIVFTHIGKTGGISLNHIIRMAPAISGKRACRSRARRERTIDPAQHNQELLHLDQIADNQLSGCDYVIGHFPFGIHDRLARSCFYITLLRNPITRLLSNVRFGLDRGKWTRDTPISELIEQGRLIDNMHTRQVASIADPDAPCTSEALATAIENLRSHYAVVGTAERFDDALKTLITLLGWPDTAYSNRQVSNAPTDPELESRVPGAAEHYFAIGIELYAYAKARPTPWSPGMLEGIVTGSVRQDSVLLTSPLVSLNNRPFALLPTALFDTQLCPTVRRPGGEVVLV